MKLLVITSLFFLLLLGSKNCDAQEDTVIVQTLTFDSITTRRGEWTFPSDTNEYRKILMLYTLKCDPATTQDNFDCGEWDYLTYTYLYDNTGNYDSTKVERGHYYINNRYEDPINYVNTATFNYNQWWDRFINYTNTSNENFYTVGTGTNSSSEPLGNGRKRNKVQVLWLASELTAAGLTAGSIDKLQLDLQQLGTELKHLRIAAKHTATTSLSAFDSNGFSELYHRNTTFQTVGINSINLTNSFTWDGTSNLLLELSFDNTTALAASSILNASITPASSVVYQTESDNYLNVENGNYIETTLNDYTFGDEITISFWSNGDAATLPANTSILEGFDSLNNRIIGIHHPWSNEQIYWDQGTGSGYDRINKSATVAEYKGNWVHWAFTKNATTGVMNIYKDGTLWHTGTGKTSDIGRINRFRIGVSADGNWVWTGKLDDVRIWNKEISQATIQAWMNKNLDPTHPDYSNLVLYYNFDGSNNIVDQSSNSYDGMPSIPNMVQPHDEIFKNMATSTERMNMTFVQGTYTSTIDSVLVVDTIPTNPVCIAEYSAAGRKFVINNLSYGWAEGYTYTYNPMGMMIDSVWNAGTNQIVNDSIHYYETPYEVINRYEIGRYITPYGIGLSLGPNGFTWVFDVTDYAPLLQGDVELSAGNQQELIDLKFMMIKGAPSRKVEQIDRIWGQSGSHSYRNLDDDVVLANTTIPLAPNTSTYKVKTRITGHGHNSTTGNYPHCCEWRDNTHYFHVNGNQVDDWHVWQTNDCALNPVYPQGGTWLGSREGWCPGDIVKEHEIEITPHVTGNTVDLDYSITPVPANNTGMGNGSYVMGMHLIQYGAATYSLDAEIYEILSPTTADYYSRNNPLCRDLQVIIRNGGSTALTSLDITYGVSGGQTETYTWTGNLAFMETEIVTLPVPHLGFWVGDGMHKFTATVSNPNGGTDQRTENDQMQSEYNIPDNYANGIRLFFRTNNRPTENSYTLTDQDGMVYVSRSNMPSNTTFIDTLNLAPGCYTLEVLDTGNDGLAYWADPNAGSGFVRLMHPSLPFSLRSFNAEFGRKLTYSFSIDMTLSQDDLPEEEVYSKVYPNPNNGSFQVELSGYHGNTSLELFNAMGQSITQRSLVLDVPTMESFDLKDLPAGVYLLKIITDDKEAIHKVVIE